MPAASKGSGRRPSDPVQTYIISPVSERQQLAIAMQISTQEAKSAAPPTPPPEKKRSRQRRNERGETPLHVAAIRGDHERVKKLLDQGQDPDVPDFAGWTPLHEACSYGWHQVVTVLVNGGANVNAKGLDDDTPLHDATASGNLNMVKFLVDHGADPNARNSKGKVPTDYAMPHIYEYYQSLKDTTPRSSHSSRSRDDSAKKGGNASGNRDSSKRSNMETLAQGEHFDMKDGASQEKRTAENRDVSVTSSDKRNYDDSHDGEPAEDDVSKRRKKREAEERELMAKPAPVARNGPGRILTGSKPPGPASKTGAVSLGKSGGVQSSSKGSSGSSSKNQSQGKGGGSKSTSQNSHQKSSSGKGSSQQGSKDRKSPVTSPKHQHHSKDDDDDHAALKVPPLKIVIPGGASCSGNRNDQEGEGGQRGSGKGRGSISTLPYVIPSTSADAGQTSDSSDGVCEDRRAGDTGKVSHHNTSSSSRQQTGQRVLRSHRTTDDKSSEGSSRHSHGFNNMKSPSSAGHDDHHGHGHSSTRGEPELHPRKRKIKASKESHSRDHKGDSSHEPSHPAQQHPNPYQMHLLIRDQIEARQKALFPVKPKPPKDFNNYLLNRRTYTLAGNMPPEPAPEIPRNMPPQMVKEFLEQEKERSVLRTQHVVEKEKLVLAVEQEILRVHGRAERAVANQPLPYSACTMLRDREVYNLTAPEQEEKRNAQRSRCNGRQINSWLQEVDDKWEKIKEGMLRRQHTEAQSLHAVQTMNWEWKLKELGICDYKTIPKIDTLHVPEIHVSNFDLPA